jgi:hypothetical protein
MNENKQKHFFTVIRRTLQMCCMLKQLNGRVVVWIRIDFNLDPAPAFELNPDPNPQSHYIRIQCGSSSGSTTEL